MPTFSEKTLCYPNMKNNFQTNEFKRSHGHSCDRVTARCLAGIPTNTVGGAC